MIHRWRWQIAFQIQEEVEHEPASVSEAVGGLQNLVLSFCSYDTLIVGSLYE